MIFNQMIFNQEKKIFNHNQEKQKKIVDFSFQAKKKWQKKWINQDNNIE